MAWLLGAGNLARSIDERLLKDRVFVALVGYVQEHGYPPTMDEMTIEVGSTRNRVGMAIDRLINDGDVTTGGKAWDRALYIRSHDLLRRQVAG